jgi:solute carrier family 25 ornithine transporter 2/15
MQTNPAQFGGVGSTVTQIFKSEGIPAFWKGAVPTAFGMALENCMAFGVNEALKRAFPDDPTTKLNGRPDLLKPFAMGAITGCCSALVLLPSEIIKAKTQVVIGDHSSNEIMKEMLKKQGVRVRFYIGPFFASKTNDALLCIFVPCAQNMSLYSPCLLVSMLKS